MFEELNLQEKLKLYADLLEKPLPFSVADIDKLRALRSDPEILDRDISKAEERLAAIKAEALALRPGLPQAPSNEALYSAKDREQLKTLKHHYLYLKDKIESSTRQLFYDERSAAALRWAFSKLSPETLKDLPKFKGFEQQPQEQEHIAEAYRIEDTEKRDSERKRRGWSAATVRNAKVLILQSLVHEDPACTVYKGFALIASEKASIGAPVNETEWLIALGQMLQDGSVRLIDGLITKGKAKKR